NWIAPLPNRVRAGQEVCYTEGAWPPSAQVFMSDASATLSGPAVPPEVREFDAQKGVNRYLGAVIDFARQAFPSSALSLSPRADRAHQYLVFRLSNCGEPTVEQAGRDLETLRRLRNRAATTTSLRSRSPRPPPPFDWPRASSRSSTPPGWSRPAPG